MAGALTLHGIASVARAHIRPKGEIAKGGPTELGGPHGLIERTGPPRAEAEETAQEESASPSDEQMGPEQAKTEEQQQGQPEDGGHEGEENGEDRR